MQVNRQHSLTVCTMVRFHLTCLVQIACIENKNIFGGITMYLNDMNSKRDFFDKTSKFYDERMKSYQENKEKAL